MSTINTPITYDHDEHDDDDSPIFEEENHTHVELQNWWNALDENSGVKFRVYRQQDAHGNEQKQPFLFSFDPSDYDFDELLEKIKDDYGGGEYRVKAYDGKKQLRKNELISIETPEGFKVRGFKAAEVNPHEQQNQMIPLLERMVEKMESNKNDSTARMMELLIGMMGQRQDNSGGGLMGMFKTPQDLLVVKQLLTGDNNNNNSGGINEALGLLSKFKELGMMDNGRETNESDILMTALQQLGPAISSAMQNKAAPANVQRIAAQDNTNPENLEQMTQQHYDSLFGMLIRRAKSNADVSPYADIIVDEFGEDYIAQLLDNGVNLADFLAQVKPEVNDQRDWFDKLAQSVENSFSGDNEGIGENGADDLSVNRNDAKNSHSD